VMRSRYDTVLYEAPHRLEKLLAEIAAIDADRELFLAKELTKKYQHYYRDSAKLLSVRLSTTTIRGEWVVVVHAREEKQRSLSFDQVLALELPPKAKAKLLSLLSDKSIKAWYETLIRKSDTQVASKN